MLSFSLFYTIAQVVSISHLRMRFTLEERIKMANVAERVRPAQPAVIRAGCGSLNIMFDLYLDRSSAAAAFSPKKFDGLIREAIKKSGMTLRKAFLDCWKSEQEGPASLFYSLEESHVRIETWPDENHVQGEVQLCNFSKDNAQATRQLAEHIISGLNPAATEIVFVSRGPGPNLLVQESIRRER